jgi:hypothetical protein
MPPLKRRMSKSGPSPLKLRFFSVTENRTGAYSNPASTLSPSMRSGSR